MKYYLMDANFNKVEEFEIEEGTSLIEVVAEAERNGLQLIPEKCQKEKCLKEVNPKAFPGVFFDDKPFQFDPNFMACYFCTRKITLQEDDDYDRDDKQEVC